MAKYLIQGKYLVDGAKGLIKEGGSSRRAAVEKLFTSAGGKMESFYYGFGSTDIYIIGELPDNISAVAMSLMVNASGAVTASVTVLLTAEDMDAAAKKQVSYRAPGQ